MRGWFKSVADGSSLSRKVLELRLTFDFDFVVQLNSIFEDN